MKIKYYIYISLFLLLCLFPSAGLLFTGIRESSENNKTAPVPALIEKDRLNIHFLNDAGEWFEDHFAFRDEAVTAYALLLEKGFGVSAQESVITGTDGWLFYKDSLADFQGTAPMSERQLFDIAHSLAMVQEYAQKNGAAFVFAAAPNKNSLYGRYMPYYCQPPHTKQSNMERLKEYLDAEHINYTDLHESFQNEGRILYHKRDSHWNNKGAALAAGQILDGIGKEHLSYTDRPYTVRKDFQGDLDQMLRPALADLEEEIYYDPLPQFDYREDVESNFAPKINTRSNGNGNLVMYRDSFGNALLPFFAEAYENAYFSRALPYYLPDLSNYKADALIIERAERFLPDMAQQAPVMEAPAVIWNADLMGPAVKIESLQKEALGEYTKVTGKLPSAMIKTRSRIYIRINHDKCYEAFPVSDADGRECFSILLRTEELQNTELQNSEPQNADHVFEVYVSEQDAKAAEDTQTGNSGAQTGDSKTELRREDYPDCDGSGHGYIEIYYSDGSVEIEEY